MGLRRATLAVCLVLCLVPVPAAARSGPSGPSAPSAPSVPSGQGLPCTADWVVRLDQPISRVASFGQFTSGGETGVINCLGEVGGHRVTGPGTYGESGAFGAGPAGGADCNNGSGAGDFTATIPTDGGRRHVEGMVSFYWLGAAGVVFDGRFPSVLRLSPGAGDCLTEPARELHFQAGGVLVVENR